MVCKTLAQLAAAVVVAGVIVGCSSHPLEKGYHDLHKIQVQFYAPPGATVTVADRCFGKVTPSRSHQISTYGNQTHRLEHEPEEFAVFNLAPGSYEFKYTAAGWNDVSTYGELEVCRASLLASTGAKEMLRRCFIPVSLPAPAALKGSKVDSDSFPYKSRERWVRISDRDVKRLAAGDMITKVVFIADLKKAREKSDSLEVQLSKHRAERQRLQALFNEAQLEWMDNPSSKRFIRLQGQLVSLDQEIRDKEDLKGRLEALLRADKVLIRREMLVLATDELLPTHDDPVVSARKLGQVVLVMRVGGRHHHWGPPAAEGQAFNK